jgi:hypothetical protein
MSPVSPAQVGVIWEIVLGRWGKTRAVGQSRKRGDGENSCAVGCSYERMHCPQRASIRFGAKNRFLEGSKIATSTRKGRSQAQASTSFGAWW